MGELTLGQYYPAESILHRLDPRVKLVGTIVYIVGLFQVSGVFGYLFAAAVLFVLVFLSKVPFSHVLKSLKPVFVLLCITMLINMFLIPGRVLWSFWIFRITAEGIRR